MRFASEAGSCRTLAQIAPGPSGEPLPIFPMQRD
jgi:hypothetical protein